MTRGERVQCQGCWWVGWRRPAAMCRPCPRCGSGEVEAAPGNSRFMNKGLDGGTVAQAIADHGGVNQAARALGITRGTVVYWMQAADIRVQRLVYLGGRLIQPQVED